MICLVIIIMISMRVIIEPSIIFSAAGRDGWISYIIVLFVQIIGIYFISKTIQNNKEKSFKEICEKRFGKAFTKVLIFMLFVYYLFRLILIDYEMQNFLLEAIYDQLNWSVAIIPVFLVIVYVAFKGERVIARLTQLITGFVAFVLIYTLAISCTNADFSNLLPVVAEGAGVIGKGVIYGFAQMGEFLTLYIFMENIKLKKENLAKALTLTSVFVGIGIVAYYILFVAVFGEAAITLKEGIIRITQFLPSNDANLRVDGIITVLWIPISIIMAAVYYLGSAKFLQNLFKINKVWAYIIIFVIVFAFKFSPQIGSAQIISINLSYFAYFTIALQVLMPVTIYFLTRKGGKGEKVFQENIKK